MLGVDSRLHTFVQFLNNDRCDVLVGVTFSGSLCLTPLMDSVVGAYVVRKDSLHLPNVDMCVDFIRVMPASARADE